MKKIFILLIGVIVLTGCSTNNKEDIEKKFIKKIKNTDAYLLTGDLELRNNDEVYNYAVEVNYEKDSFYKVSLTNKSNESTQIILKNKEGVYILTPSLNRSFKFQSDWPYNNSQIYLLHALIRDLEGENTTIEEDKDDYVFTTDVNYPNNSDLVKQKIYVTKKNKLKKVVVYDKDDVPSMELVVNKLDFSPNYKEGYFDLNTIMETYSIDEDIAKQTGLLEDSIYPLMLPDGTKLGNEEKIKTSNGERILMTFEGEKPFLLVEETANVLDEFTVIPTNGEPYRLMDTLGVMTDNSLSWVSNGIEYYIVSDVLNTDELVDIAESIYVLPTMK